MTEDDSYEIMPYKEIVSLKKEIEQLKKRTGDTSSQELINSMSKLTKGMDSMLQLFRTAAEEMAAEQTTEDKFAEKLTPLLHKLDDIMDQNKIIAEGMVAIADSVKDHHRKEKTVDFNEKPLKLSQERNFGQLPPIAEPADIPNAPEMPDFGSFQSFERRQSFGPPPGQQNMGMLPPGPPPPGPHTGSLPPLEPKKKGLFGFGRK